MGEPQNVTEAVAAIMEELPGIGKNRQASAQQGGYSYRGIDDITAALQPLFAKFRVVLFPRVTDIETHELVVNDKPWTDTILRVSYDVCHGPSDTKMQVDVIGIGRDNSDKGANKALTQAFKYALLQTFCISDPSDDSDSGSPATDVRYERPRSGQRHRDTSSPGQATDNMTALLRKLVGEIYEARTGQTIPESAIGMYLGDLLGTEPVKITGIGFKECSDLITKVMAVKKGGVA